MSNSEVKEVKFKLVGANEGKTLNLGANKQYKFVKGVCTLECNESDAKKHAHILGKFYSAKRVRPTKPKE